MHIVQLLSIRSTSAVKRVLIITSLAGLANAAIIGLINQVAEHAAFGEPIGTDLVLLYIGLLGFFILADRTSLREANRFLQKRLAFLRTRLVRNIRSVELRTVENLDRSALMNVVGQEINHLSQTFPMLVSAAQSGVLLVFSLLYIGTLSPVSFFVVTGVTLVGLVFFWFRRRMLDDALVVIHGYENAVMEKVSDFTQGFQELRLNADRSDDIYRDFQGEADDLRGALISIGNQWSALLQFSNAFLFALVGTVVFVLPMFFEGYTDVIYKITAAAIFCVGPVTTITSAAPAFARAQIGLGHVFRLDARLREINLDHDGGMDFGTQPNERTSSSTVDAQPSRFAEFSKLTFQDVTFRYVDDKGAPGFVSGPWSLELHRGEVVYLTGGNGSGKSTMMRLLCGLYRPDGGQILVDGRPIEPAESQDFREMFGAVFSDFHLFARLYGLEDVDPVHVRTLIDRMELTDIVDFENGQFSTIKLSTGQRKRLAMIVALLEDRPIFFFDEWAADQDAQFREVFYKELIPDLKARGKTVVAVTHDELYWDTADRRLVLDFGLIQ